jgi:hypothetical protein
MLLLTYIYINKYCDRLPAVRTGFDSLRSRDQTGPKTHTAFKPMVIGQIFQRFKAAGPWTCTT